MYFPRFNIGLNKVLQQAEETTDYFVNNIDRLPESAYTSIRFEDLCAQPQATFEQIFDFLQITPVVPIDYQSLISKRPTTLLPTVASNRQRIAQRLASYFKLHSYSP